VGAQNGNAFGGERTDLLENKGDCFSDANHGDIITRSRATFNNRRRRREPAGASLALDSWPDYNPRI
jgi:hypothetical protein